MQSAKCKVQNEVVRDGAARPTSHSAFCTPNSAFTLVELMISIALVVLLMYGVQKVFSLSSQAASAGNAVSSGVRDARSAQAVFTLDLGNADPAMPFMIIRSTMIPAFRNKDDQLSDRDYNPAAVLAGRQAQTLSIDLNGNNTDGEGGFTTAGGENFPSTTYNYRNHRTDVFSFFSRDMFRRQTGNDGTYAADQTSLEAWVWYGHLWLQNNKLDTDPEAFFCDAARTIPTFPGSDIEDTNPNNFFASQWILGRMPMLLRAPDPAAVIADRQGIAQDYIARTTASSPNLTPLSAGSPSNVGTYTIQQSRYDLAGTSSAAFKTVVDTEIAGGNINWWVNLMTGAVAGVDSGRFQGKSYLGKPMDSAEMSKQAPVFVKGCSQFMVEFAGDYLIQNPADGQITGGGVDGEIDYWVVDAGTPNERRQIRWYGMPRDTSGDGAITFAGFDVMPLRDSIVGYGFEKVLPTAAALRPNGDYATVDLYFTSGNTPNYICAWGPGDPKPKMIRIVMTIDDATGKLADGQTFEYVFKLP